MMRPDDAIPSYEYYDDIHDIARFVLLQFFLSVLFFGSMKLLFEF